MAWVLGMRQPTMRVLARRLPDTMQAMTPAAPSRRVRSLRHLAPTMARETVVVAAVVLAIALVLFVAVEHCHDSGTV